MTPGHTFLSTLFPPPPPPFQLVLGDTALQSIRPDLSIAKIHGHPFVPALPGKGVRPNPYLRVPVYLPTFDPDDALYDKATRALFREDLKLFARIVAEPNHLAIWPARCIRCPKEGWKQPVDLLTYCETHAPPLNRRIPKPVREMQTVLV